MRLRIEQELEDLRCAVDAQAARDVAPLAQTVDRNQSFSQELWAAVRELGLTRLSFDEECGGGGTVRAYIVGSTELARHSAVAALSPGTTIQVATTVLQHGRDSQIDRVVPGLVAGDTIASWAFTNRRPDQIRARSPLGLIGAPTGGYSTAASNSYPSPVRPGLRSCLHALQTRLSGRFSSIPQRRAGPSVPQQGLVHGGTEARPVTLDDVHVTEVGLIGSTDAGFLVMLAGEAFGKVRAAAIRLGIAIRALEEATRYALTRTHRGVSNCRRFPTIQALLGADAADVVAAESLII